MEDHTRFRHVFNCSATCIRRFTQSYVSVKRGDCAKNILHCRVTQKI